MLRQSAGVYCLCLKIFKCLLCAKNKMPYGRHRKNCIQTIQNQNTKLEKKNIELKQYRVKCYNINVQPEIYQQTVEISRFLMRALTNSSLKSFVGAPSARHRVDAHKSPSKSQTWPQTRRIWIKQIKPEMNGKRKWRRPSPLRYMLVKFIVLFMSQKIYSIYSREARWSVKEGELYFPPVDHCPGAQNYIYASFHNGKH